MVEILNQEDTIRIELSRTQALVLFELLARETEGDGPINLVDPSELHALWNLEGKIEKQLDELLPPDYAALLEQARVAWRTLRAG